MEREVFSAAPHARAVPVRKRAKRVESDERESRLDGVSEEEGSAGAVDGNGAGGGDGWALAQLEPHVDSPAAAADGVAVEKATADVAGFQPPVLSSWVLPMAAIGGALAFSSGGGGSSSPAPSVTVSGVIHAGELVEGHGLSVDLYQADGVTRLNASSITVADDGSFEFSYDGPYRGAVIARVRDDSAGADYLDEASAAAVDLAAVLMAVDVLSEGAAGLVMVINPLTTIAAIKAGMSGSGSGSIANIADVQAANAAVARAFGLGDASLTQQAPTIASATNPGDAYGRLLASLSGADRLDPGGTQAVIERLALGVDIATGTLLEDGKRTLAAGARAADDNVSGDLAAFVFDAFDRPGSVSLSGSPLQGQTLSATLIDADGVSSGGVVFEWRADGVVIAGATGSTYTLAQSDVGKSISVRAAYVDNLGFAESVTGSRPEAIANRPEASSAALAGFGDNGAPVTGALRLGDTIRVTVTLDEAATLEGSFATPASVLLQLDGGGQVRARLNAALSGGVSLVFDHVVMDGETDFAGGVTLVSGSLDLGSQTLTFASGQALVESLPASQANSLTVDSSPLLLSEWVGGAFQTTIDHMAYTWAYNPAAWSATDQAAGNGGVSGMDYDPLLDGWYLISDAKAAPRMMATTNGLDAATGKISLDLSGAVQTIALGGTNTFDGESIRVWNSEAGLSFFMSSEGLSSVGLPPRIQERDSSGAVLRDFAIPDNLAYVAGSTTEGARNNFIFEGIALSPDGTRLWAALEQPLFGDGAAPTLTTGAMSRIVEFDVATGQATRQFAYRMEPILLGENLSSLLPATTSFNGIAEILAVDNDTLLVMERSVASGSGFAAKVFEVDLTAVAEIHAGTDLTLGSVALAKTELISLKQNWVSGVIPSVSVTAGGGTTSAAVNVLQNLEAMTWGPRVDGHDTLLLLSDNNFSSAQSAQLWQFAVL